MPTLTYDGFRFVLDVPFTERETAKAVGFHWDAVNRKWWTGVTSVARIFESCADSKAKWILGAEDREIDKSRALTSNLVIPARDGLSYLPFQKAGVEYCQPRKNTLVADQMGTGKTITATGVINYNQGIENILVVCPSSLKINWGRELVKWLVRPLVGAFAYEKYFPEDDVNIVILNYEIVKRFRDFIDRRHWDLAIFDESHYLKNFGAQRTKACLGDPEGEIAPIQAEKRLFMTGTPILNRPFELWPTLTVADPDDLGISEYGFLERYTKFWAAPWGNEYRPKKEMMDDLQRRLRAKIMLRRLKSEVLPQLPPKRRQIIALPSTAAKKVIQAELEFFDKNKHVVEAAVARAENTQTGDDLSFELAAGDLEKGRSAHFSEISALRKATGLAKLPFVIEYIEQALEQEEKIVAFGHHREVIEKLAQHFGKRAVMHYGGMTDTVKQKSIDRFNEDESCRLFIGAISIAQGFNLVVASLALVFELDWRPAMITQAEDRLHRIGQVNAVLIQHLLFDGSLDANMIKKILEKQEIIDMALG